MANFIASHQDRFHGHIEADQMIDNGLRSPVRQRYRDEPLNIVFTFFVATLENLIEPYEIIYSASAKPVEFSA